MSYQPEWAEKALQRPSSAFDEAELLMLREFFDAWEGLHSITGDKRERHVKAKYEAAAQNLVDKATAYRRIHPKG